MRTFFSVLTFLLLLRTILALPSKRPSSSIISPIEGPPFRPIPGDIIVRKDLPADLNLKTDLFLVLLPPDPPKNPGTYLLVPVYKNYFIKPLSTEEYQDLGLGGQFVGSWAYLNALHKVPVTEIKATFCVKISDSLLVEARTKYLNLYDAGRLPGSKQATGAAEDTYQTPIDQTPTQANYPLSDRPF